MADGVLVTAAIGGGQPVGTMIAALFWVAISGAFTAALWAAGHRMFARPPLLTSNYRGHELPTAAGVFVILGPVFAMAAASVLAVVPIQAMPEGLFARVGSLEFAVAVVVPLGLLGFLDDLLGAGQHGGFGGHLRAGLRGELTTGLLKLVGGGLIGLWAAARVAGGAPGWSPLGRVVLWGCAVALWANVGNLFDRAPGRTIKVGVTATLGVAVVAFLGCDVPLTALCGPLAIAAAAVAIAPADLGERCMLGDAGSNVVGAAVALAGLLSWPGSWPAALGFAAVALLVNLASERVSFSRVIAANRVLSALDRAGAPHRGKPADG